MEQTVYIDLLFLINCSMDFLCFYIAAGIISVKLSIPRAFIASLIGGAYAVVALFISVVSPFTVVLDVAICIFMCAIVFKKEQGLIFSSLVYFSVSMALGGFMTALFNLLNRMGFNRLIVEEGQEDGISVWFFGALALLSGLFTSFSGKFFRKRSAIKSVLITIEHKNRKKELSALVDSGNLLCEPISGKACIVVDIGALAEVIPKEVLDIAQNDKLCGFEGIAPDILKKIRLVPTHTATGERMLVGFRADTVILDTGKRSYKSDTYLVLSNIEDSLEARALVPSQLLN